MGRKSGTKAIEFPARAPSKKQLKRRAQLMIRLGEKRDPKKEAIRDSKVKHQMSNPKLDEEIQTLFNEMQPEVFQLSMPNPELQTEDPHLPSIAMFTIDGVTLLEHFDQFGRQQRVILDTNIDSSEPKKSKFLRDRTQNYPTVVNGTSLTTAKLEREANAYVQHKLHIFFQTMNPWFPRKEVPPEYSAVRDIFLNLERHNLRIDIASYTSMIRFQSYYGQYQSADVYFDNALELCPPDDIDNSMKLWAAKIENLGRSGQISEALAVLDRLQKNFQSTAVTLYNPLLRVLADGKHSSEFDSFWLRMHSDGIDMNVESFNICLKGLAFRGEVERSFFVFREMLLSRIQPNTESFCMLLHACSKAPYWVKGYEDIVYEAMDLIEAAEFEPNLKIYNAIINVFAQCGDPMAAEYYFWEMQRKGIPPDGTTYNVLLEAYARAQSVGVKYGHKGRYTPPPPRPLTENEKAMREIGALRTGHIMASGVFAEPVQPGRGTKNEEKKIVLVDIYDDEEAREAAMTKIRQEAEKLREVRRRAVAKEMNLPMNSSETDTTDDGKVRITWSDDSEQLEKALLKTGGKIDSLSLNGDLISNDNDDDNEEPENDNDSERYGQNVDNNAAIDAILDENLPSSLHRKQQKQHRRIWERMRDEYFKDPYVGEEDLKGNLWADHLRRTKLMEKRQRLREKMRERRLRKLNEGNDASEVVEDAVPEDEVVVDTKALATKKEIELSERMNQRVNIISALDKTEDVQQDLDMMRKEIDKEWDYRSFGRAPPQDYSMGLIAKQNIIKHRAMLAFENMVLKRIVPNASHWNRLLAVHSEAMRTEEALTVFRNIKAKDNLVDSKTYEYLIRMFVRTGDVDKAVGIKEEAVTRGLIPTTESYGLLIRAHSHRQQIVEALKVLEEARNNGVPVHDRNLKFLRSRCHSLGVSHPDMPPDPTAWVKTLKQERRNAKHTSNRRVQPLVSKYFR
jgi:pentatricopeptide repeat protein